MHIVKQDMVIIDVQSHATTNDTFNEIDHVACSTYRRLWNHISDIPEINSFAFIFCYKKDDVTNNNW